MTVITALRRVVCHESLRCQAGQAHISTWSLLLCVQVGASRVCHRCNVATADLCRCMQPLLLLMLTSDVKEASCCCCGRCSGPSRCTHKCTAGSLICCSMKIRGQEVGVCKWANDNSRELSYLCTIVYGDCSHVLSFLGRFSRKCSILHAWLGFTLHLTR